MTQEELLNRKNELELWLQQAYEYVNQLEENKKWQIDIVVNVIDNEIGRMDWHIKVDEEELRQINILLEKS